MAILLVIFTLLGVISAQSNWIFYGTKLVAKNNEENRIRPGPRNGRDEEMVTETPLVDLFKSGNARKLEEIKEYIKENCTEPKAVLGNFQQTGILRHEVRDKAYYDDKLLEHACPLTIRASNQTAERRIPDIIGVGFAKCGTGALAFLDCHPRAVFRTTEPRFFDQEARLKAIIEADENNNQVEIQRFRTLYSQKLPLAAKDEILIEKSPQYAGGVRSLRELRARAMKIINPNAKLIAVICDPIKRAFSQLSMKDRRTKDRESRGQSKNCRSCLKNSLPEAIDRFTQNMNRSWREHRPSGYAAFSDYLEPFQAAFGDGSLLIVDGENLIKDANYEFTRIVEFIGLDSTHFKFNVPNGKGFPCLQEPIKFCLNSAKGTSRKIDVTSLYPRKTLVWKRTFQPSIRKTIIAFKICPKIDAACCLKLKNRFIWASRYFCPVLQSK